MLLVRWPPCQDPPRLDDAKEEEEEEAEAPLAAAAAAAALALKSRFILNGCVTVRPFSFLTRALFCSTP